MAGLYLGMISGTSVDGVDTALCELGDSSCRIIAAQTFAYPPAIRARIEALIGSGAGTLAEIGALDVAVGRFFADCALALIRGAGHSPGDVDAIGHHGQTIWHVPDPPEPFSWQIGDPNSIAAITGIETVADLRRRDMAVGGQGAPLLPAFLHWAMRNKDRAHVIVNIGGIANICLLRSEHDVIGFDTGPGNTLLDLWTRRCLDQAFDDGGRWAASGTPDRELLEACLNDPYFDLEPPKSTGREYFNESWLMARLSCVSPALDDVNIAATLVELTATTIASSIAALDPGDYELVVYGGGARNAALMARLASLTGRQPVTMAAFGLDPDYVEAAAMAWLARARKRREPGNLPTVTAARQAVVLGALYCGDRTQD